LTDWLSRISREESSDRNSVAPDTLAARLIRGIGAGLIGHAISLLARIALPPLFLHAWGVDLYGEWLLLTAFAANIILADLGGGVYVVNRMTQEFAVGHLSALRRTLQTALLIFTCFPAIVAFILATVTWTLSVRSIFSINVMEESAANLVVTMLVVQMALALPQGLLLGVFRAVGQLPRGVMFANALQLTQLALVAGGLLTGAGPVLVSTLQLFPYIIIGFVSGRIINRDFPSLGLFSTKEADIGAAKEFARPSLNFFSIQISQALSIQGIVLIVGLTLGPAQAVAFSTIRTLCNAMKSMLALVSHTVWPEMTRFASQNNSDALVTLFRGNLRTSMVGATIVVFILNRWGDGIYELWLSGAVPYDGGLMALFLIFLLQQVFWNTCSHVLMAVNHHYGLSRVVLASSILAIATSYIGAKLAGLEGLVVGMLAAELLLPLWLVPQFLRSYNRAFTGEFFFTELVPPCSAVLVLYLFAPLAFALLVFLILWWWAGAKQIFRIQRPGKGR
jgi:O-antigen/teichoic acid export membrane protein